MAGKHGDGGIIGRVDHIHPHSQGFGEEGNIVAEFLRGQADFSASPAHFRPLEQNLERGAGGREMQAVRRGAGRCDFGCGLARKLPYSEEDRPFDTAVYARREMRSSLR